jgi:hypothetical protein
MAEMQRQMQSFTRFVQEELSRGIGAGQQQKLPRHALMRLPLRPVRGPK